jgi:hypothetical protein
VSETKSKLRPDWIVKPNISISKAVGLGSKLADSMNYFTLKHWSRLEKRTMNAELAELDWKIYQMWIFRVERWQWMKLSQMSQLLR